MLLDRALSNIREMTCQLQTCGLQCTVFQRLLLVLLVNWSHLALHFYVRHFFSRPPPSLFSTTTTSLTSPHSGRHLPAFCRAIASPYSCEIKWPRAYTHRTSQVLSPYAANRTQRNVRKRGPLLNCVPSVSLYQADKRIAEGVGHDVKAIQYFERGDFQDSEEKYRNQTPFLSVP